MSDAFDGAGEPYRGPSWKAGILILLGIIIATIHHLEPGQLGHGSCWARTARWTACRALPGAGR